MPVFLWEGQTRKGEKKKGEIDLNHPAFRCNHPKSDAVPSDAIPPQPGPEPPFRL